MTQKQDGLNIYVTMKTMYSLGYYCNDFVATHAPGHMIHGYIAGTNKPKRSDQQVKHSV